MYLYFNASIFIGIKYDVNKKIVVRYPPGTGGRYIACIVESMLNSNFSFDLDTNGGVHTNPYMENVSHTHDLMFPTILDNVGQDLKLIQIVVSEEYSWDCILLYYLKVIKHFKKTDTIKALCRKYNKQVDDAWCLAQVTTKTISDDLYNLMHKELLSYIDNTKEVIHPRVLNLTHGDVLYNDILHRISVFVQAEDYDYEKILANLKKYRKLQTAILQQHQHLKNL